jgi:anti-anti-sigma factor
MAQQRAGCDVVIDFSSVDIVTSASFSYLLRLQRLADDIGHRLVLCGIQAATKGIFDITGLDDVFETCEHMSEAMARLQAGLID